MNLNETITVVVIYLNNTDNTVKLLFLDTPKVRQSELSSCVLEQL